MTWDPLKYKTDKSMLIVSVCMGKSIRMKGLTNQSTNALKQWANEVAPVCIDINVNHLHCMCSCLLLWYECVFK